MPVQSWSRLSVARTVSLVAPEHAVPHGENHFTVRRKASAGDGRRSERGNFLSCVHFPNRHGPFSAKTAREKLRPIGGKCDSVASLARSESSDGAAVVRVQQGNPAIGIGRGQQKSIRRKGE